MTVSTWWKSIFTRNECGFYFYFYLCSCFLVKSQLELSGTQNNLRTYAQKQLHAIEKMYCDYLAKEMSRSSAKTKASCLMMSIFGLRVYGYIEQDSKKILITLKENLAWLAWDKL